MAEEKENTNNSVHSRAVNTVIVNHDNPDNVAIFSDKAHQIVKLLNGLSISQIKSVVNNVIEIVEEHLPIVVQRDDLDETHRGGSSTDFSNYQEEIKANQHQALRDFSDPSRGRDYCIAT